MLIYKTVSQKCHVNLHTQCFDFIECFTTTFLRAHSWLNWVDEDDDEHDTHTMCLVLITYSMVRFVELNY